MTSEAAPKLVTFPRQEFIEERWDYRPGEHVAFIAPTQSGKTTLMFQLLHYTANPKLKAVVLVAKPRDRVVDKYRKLLRFKLTRSWPPMPSIWGQTNGWVVWPRTTFDTSVDYPHKYRIFRNSIQGAYKTRKKRIIVVDEWYVICALLGLEPESVELLASGSSMDAGGWFATQKPSHVSTWLYGNSDHVFLAYDPDERNRKRFGEIGGVDPKMVSSGVLQLQQYQWLYIRRRGRVMCIVDK